MFNYKTYFLLYNNLEKVYKNKNNYGLYRTRYGLNARQYRLWSRKTYLLQRKQPLLVKSYNNGIVFPWQRVFFFNNLLLSWKLKKVFNKTLFSVSYTTFPHFNRWVRTILTFYRPKKIFYKIISHDSLGFLKFILLLNFKRNRFFPSIRPMHESTFASLSLGLFRRFTRRSRAWTKTKLSYLLLASFLRKVLMYGRLNSVYLFINRAPKHLASILHTIQSPSLSIYEYPYLNFKRDPKTKKFLYKNNKIQFNTPESGSPMLYPVNEEFDTFEVQFPFIIFTNSKAYAPTKQKKRGSIKRQYVKKIILLNRIAEYL